MLCLHSSVCVWLFPFKYAFCSRLPQTDQIASRPWRTHDSTSTFVQFTQLNCCFTHCSQPQPKRCAVGQVTWTQLWGHWEQVATWRALDTLRSFGEKRWNTAAMHPLASQSQLSGVWTVLAVVDADTVRPTHCDCPCYEKKEGNCYRQFPSEGNGAPDMPTRPIPHGSLLSPRGLG